MGFRGKVEERAAQREMALKLINLVRLSDMQISSDADGSLSAPQGMALEAGIDAIVASMYETMCKADEQLYGFVMEVVQRLKSERMLAAQIASEEVVRQR